LPVEDVSTINAKLHKGYGLDVSYLDTADYCQTKVSPPEAASCWKPVSEVLLTSYTRFDADRQVATVTALNPVTGLLTLDAPIEKPIMVADDPTFALEAALLTRPVVFKAKSDDGDATIGSHLIIHHTDAVQYRYPIYFYGSCGDQPNSIVKRNVV
jgi:hypothetical protein